MSSLQAKLQHKYALSEKGAKDMIKAFVSVTCSDLVLMFPVWMLYFLVRDYLQGTMALSSSDRADNVGAVSCHVPGNLCGERCAQNCSGRAAA